MVANKPLNLYPTLHSMSDVVSYAQSLLPIMDNNTLMTLLHVCRNTVLKEQL